MDATIMADEKIFMEALDQESNLRETEPAETCPPICLYVVNGIPVHNTPKLCGVIEGKKW